MGFLSPIDREHTLIAAAAYVRFLTILGLYGQTMRDIASEGIHIQMEEENITEVLEDYSGQVEVTCKLSRMPPHRIVRQTLFYNNLLVKEQPTKIMQRLSYTSEHVLMI
jgi:hypothetical protein